MTLVELLVAMFIMAIVMAMVLRTLGDATNTKSSVEQDTSSALAVDQTISQLATDLRMAVNPNRDLATPKQLLLGRIGTTVDVRDVLMAAPFELRVVADMVPSTATYECVIYRVDARGSLWRAISSDTIGCRITGGALLDLRRMMPGAGVNANASASQSDFTSGNVYQHRADGPSPAASFGYSVLRPVAGTDLCVSRAYATIVAPEDAARMVSVNFIAYDIRSRAATLGKVAQVYDDTITMRSHSTLSHRMNVGCGASDDDS